MKFIIGIPLILSIIATLSAASEEHSGYTTKYDNVDLDEILRNDRLLKNYVDCLLEKAHCTPDGLELKQNMPDAIETNCSKCSEKQKEGSEKMMHYLIDNRPEWWEPLEAKYDSSGSYRSKYLQSKKNDSNESNNKSGN